MEDFLNFTPQEKNWRDRQDSWDQPNLGLLPCVYGMGAEWDSSSCITGWRGVHVRMNWWVFIDLSSVKLFSDFFPFFLNMRTFCLSFTVFLWEPMKTFSPFHWLKTDKLCQYHFWQDFQTTSPLHTVHPHIILPAKNFHLASIPNPLFLDLYESIWRYVTFSLSSNDLSN